MLSIQMSIDGQEVGIILFVLIYILILVKNVYKAPFTS